VEHVNAGLKSL